MPTNKMSTDIMSNRHNVEQTKFRTDKMSTDKMHVIPCIQNTEENIAKYAVEANLFQLGSTNPKKIYPAPGKNAFKKNQI